MDKKISVLIADDDFGMRMVLRKALAKREEFDVIGEAENGEVAFQMYDEYRPEVIFLDIEMPILNGIECARKIFDIDPKVKIIFGTAHEGFMAQAFEVYAFDYLMKPFDITRLMSSIDRIIESREKAKPSIKEFDENNISKKIVIKNKEGMMFIDCDDIILVQREERKTIIYTRKDKFSTSESLGNIEDKLDPRKFLRSHKSYILNMSKITNIYPYGRWTYIVKFGDYEYDALMTHKKFDELEKLMAQ